MEKFTKSDLIKIAKDYNIHVLIPKYYSLRKDDLVNKMNQHLIYDPANKKIVRKEHSPIDVVAKEKKKRVVKKKEVQPVEVKPVEVKEKSLEELMTNEDKEIIKELKDKINKLHAKADKLKGRQLGKAKIYLDPAYVLERKLQDYEYNISKRSPLWEKGRDIRYERNRLLDITRRNNNIADKKLYEDKLKKTEEDLEILKKKFEKLFGFSTFFGSGNKTIVGSGYLDNYNLKELRRVCRIYNVHNKITRFTKLTKSELIEEMKKHFTFENNKINIKKQDIKDEDKPTKRSLKSAEEKKKKEEEEKKRKEEAEKKELEERIARNDKARADEMKRVKREQDAKRMADHEEFIRQQRENAKKSLKEKKEMEKREREYEKKKKEEEEKKRKEEEEKEERKKQRREAEERIKQEEEEREKAEEERREKAKKREEERQAQQDEMNRKMREQEGKRKENIDLDNVDKVALSAIKQYIMDKVSLEDLYNIYDTKGTSTRRMRASDSSLRRSLFLNVNVETCLEVFKKTNIKLYNDVMKKIPEIIKSESEFSQPEIVKKPVKLEKGFEFIKELQKLGSKNKNISQEYSSSGGYVSEILSLLFYEKYNLSYPLKMIEIYKNSRWSYDKFIKSFKRGIYAGETLFCAPLTTKTHMNLLIFKVDTREIIRFEPHGSATGDRAGKMDNQFNRFCESLTKKINKDLDLNKKGKRAFKFVPPSDICPRKPNSEAFKNGFQGMENRIGEKGGFCQLWSMFFIECVLRNPDMDIKEVYENAYNIMNDSPQFFLDVIKGYFVQVNELLKDIGFFKKTLVKNEIENLRPNVFYDKYYKYIKKVNEEIEKKPKKEFTGKGFKLPQIYKRK